jgi:hypothetical protein
LRIDALEADPAAAIILESPNARDLTLADLNVLVEDLQQVIRSAGRTDLDVAAVACEPVGVANHFAETLHCFLPSADFLKDQLYTLLTLRILAFMRKRFARPHEGSRPRAVILYDDRGNPLRTIEQKTALGEPIDAEPYVLTVRSVPERGRHH